MPTRRNIVSRGEMKVKNVQIILYVYEWYFMRDFFKFWFEFLRWNKMEFNYDGVLYDGNKSSFIHFQHCTIYASRVKQINEINIHIYIAKNRFIIIISVDNVLRLICVRNIWFVRKYIRSWKWQSLFIVDSENFFLITYKLKGMRS